ncbi:pyridoxamine 5'-phosphate oxidase family protein [Nocardia sp. NPDC048505]|uniref:pyridoxamine 5'-phosphate oxidase family protein n=1 Tax=unclassified Nocardia TaxID=2637762 RepID=UPI0033FA4C44
MSAQDLPPELIEIIARFELAFLVTVGDLGPHTTPQHPALDNGRFLISGPGPVTCRNITATPAVTLLWPPAGADDHVLIIDGHAVLRDFTLEVIPAQAVLHHTGEPESATRKCADCRRFNLAPPHLLGRTGS